METVPTTDPRVALRGQLALYAAAEIAPLTVIGSYTGRVMVDTEYRDQTRFLQRAQHDKYAYEIRSSDEWTIQKGGSLPASLIIDAYDCGSDLGFINDYHCDPMPASAGMRGQPTYATF